MVYMPHWPIPPFCSDDSGLENVVRLLHSLGNPHLKLPPTIHIAGTNGKGSSAAYLRSIFEAAGCRVHCYTSPHLIDFNERIVVASEIISNDYLFDICERTRIKAEELEIYPKFFEATTVAAFLAFSEVAADVLILETGMGGRLDPTNLVPRPALTVLTPVSFDHMEYLGPTLPIIAAEKGGIIKPGVPCVISQQEDEVYQIFADICEQLRSPICAYGYDFGIDKLDDGFKLLGLGIDNIIFPLPSLAGDHQIVNAATIAAGVLQYLSQIPIHCEKRKAIEHISSAISSTKWSGRIERIDLPTGPVWADGAHNPAGAHVLALWMKDNLRGPVSLIVGLTKNRDVMNFLRPFIGVVDQIYTVHVKSEPSSYSAEVLANLAASLPIPITLCDSLEDAINLSSHQDRVVAGSLFLVADLYKLMGMRPAE